VLTTFAVFLGVATELQARLNKLVSDDTRRSRHWPKALNTLSKSLRRMAGNLRFWAFGLRQSSMVLLWRSRYEQRVRT